MRTLLASFFAAALTLIFVPAEHLLHFTAGLVSPSIERIMNLMNLKAKFVISIGLPGLLCLLLSGSLRADTQYTATFTCDPSSTCSSLPTATAVSFSDQTSIDVTVFGATVTLFLLPPDKFSDPYQWEAKKTKDKPTIPYLQIRLNDVIITSVNQSITCSISALRGGDNMCFPGGGPLDPAGATSFEMGSMSFAPATVPEPSSLALMLAGVGLLLALIRK